MLRDQCLDALERCLADTTHAWDLDADGNWTRRTPDGEPRSAQRELMARHAEHAV